MSGSVSFRLEPAEGRGAATQDDDGHPGNETTADPAGALELAPPRLPYAPDPGSYTQLWTSQSARTTAEEMKDDMESYLVPYTYATPDYAAVQVTILNSVDWMGFLTVLSDDQVVLVHSLGLFSSGLGRQTAAHNRIFGLIGEKVGNELPPMVMAPVAGLVPWLKVQEQLEPNDADLAQLESGRARTIPIPTAPLTEEDHGKRSVQNMCFVPRAWAPYFLAPMTPWHALQVYKRLLNTIPPALRNGFDFLGSWLAVACTHAPGATPAESLLRARWQNPHSDRRMIGWMQRHTRFVNAMPETGLAGGLAPTLDPQECFNKALETVAALRPPSDSGATKKYTAAELQRLRAACSLSVADMETLLPPFHNNLLAEGRTKKGTEAVLAQALRPSDDSDDPGLIYVSPELVSDIKDCKYGLGWDTSYRNCHRGLSPFAVPHMSMRHQQERSAYQDRLGRASTITIEDVEKGESAPNPAPRDYHGLLQVLSNYIRLLTVVLGTQSAHTREVVAIRRKLRVKIDLYIDVGPREILYLLWAVFLDARDFLSQQVGPMDDLPESQLRYTTNFLGVGRIPMDIMGVPLSQFGAEHPRSTDTTITTTGSRSGSRSGSREDTMFKPADWVAQTNPSIPDDISALTMPLMKKFPKATADALMAHADLRYDDIRVGNKGACLNFNLLGACTDKNCTYRHSRANPTAERAKFVADKLKPAIETFIAAGAPTGPNRKRKRAT
jgi:hypothetical protein